MCSVAGENTKSEIKWRVLHQGDVSPYKLVVSLLIRELYLPPSSSGDVRKHGTTLGSGDDRIISASTLLLVYKLITANEMTFPELKELIQSPAHKIRPEVYKRFNRILSNLEPGNSYFLYELIYSIISIELAQTNILKKKIGKNSPFGKFLRSVYMNIRRMSYPQVHFLYSQLTQYLNMKRKKTAATLDDSSIHGIVPIKVTPESSQKEKSLSKGKDSQDFKTDMKRFRGLEIFQRLTDRLHEEKKKAIGERIGIGSDIFSQYIFEYRKATGHLSEVEEKAYGKCLTEKKERTIKALKASQSLRELWKPSKPPGTLLNEMGKGDDSSIGSRKRKTLSSRKTPHLTPIRSSTRSPRKSRVTGVIISSITQPQEFLIVEEYDDGYFIPSDEESSSFTALAVPSSFLSPSKSPNKGKRQQQPIATSTPVFASPKVGTPQDELEKDKLVSKLVPILNDKWDAVQGWNRKQIEKTVKRLADQLYHTNTKLPSPKDISEFIEAAFRNPSAQVIAPQLYFLEYLNCLRLKDFKHCSDSLRTSFDIRIKPNSSELNKGTPYAAYNFALFYNTLGYRQDAMASLEEAFRAGHAAGDVTCLHHCHNLWSSFHNKPYKNAIVSGSQEVDSNMAYLHSLNVIANAFEYHYLGVAPEEVLHSMWHYNVECDLEEMEALLLTSLCSFFTIYGWHEMIPFPAQIILYSKFNWPTRAYCFALCSLSQSLLFHGDVELPLIFMEYGKEIFESDVSPAGELFAVQYAVFNAIKAYLGHKPLSCDLISTLAAFDAVEALYWRAYNKVIHCDWEEASSLLNKLWISLNKSDISFTSNDMKIRCLLLQAELECLSKCSASALNHLSEALELAYLIYSDVFITLTLSHIASVQCEMGLLTSASKTMTKDMRAGIRCSSPWLKARLNIVNVKLSMRLQEKISKINYDPLMEKLDVAEELYEKWENKYKLKEILHLKIELMERSQEPNKGCDELRKKFDETESYLPWSSSTCQM